MMGVKARGMAQPRSYRAGSMGAPIVNGVQAPYGPVDFAADAFTKFVGQPLYNIATGKTMRDMAAPRDAVPMSDDPREAMAVQEHNRSNAARALGAGMEAGGMAALGSFGGARAATAPANTVYHYGTVPVGGRFDPSKSVYGGDVFVSPQQAAARASANQGNGTMHKLNMADDLNIFDYDNPAHVQAAMKYWDNATGGKNIAGRDRTQARLRAGQGLEPDAPGDVNPGSINKFIRDNFDGYYQNEGGAKNIGIHRPNSLFNQDGSTFYANNKQAAAAPAALDMAQSARLQRAREMGFDTDQTWYHGSRTGRIDKADKSGIQEWFPITSSPETASNFAASSFDVPNDKAAIFPFRLNNRNIFDFSNPQHIKRLKEAMGEKDAGRTGWWQVKNGEWDELEAINPRYFEKAGFNGYRFYEEGKDAVALDVNSGALRSVNAAFDPAKASSPNLMAANPFPGAVVPMFAPPDRRKR